MATQPVPPAFKIETVRASEARAVAREIGAVAGFALRLAEDFKALRDLNGANGNTEAANLWQEAMRLTDSAGASYMRRRSGELPVITEHTEHMRVAAEIPAQREPH